MARYSIRIDRSVESFTATAARHEAAARGIYADRVPVSFCITPRVWTAIAGIPYGDLFHDLETHYLLLLQYMKWRLETLREDLQAEPVLMVAPFFDNVVNASAFGAEVPSSADEPLRALPTLRDPSDMRRVVPPSYDAGFWGKTVTWWHAMKEMASGTEVSFDGRPGLVQVAPLSIGGEGPHMVAVDLAGTDFYWWQVEKPAECAAFLAMITEAMADAERRFRQIDPRPREAYGIAEDSAQAMSADMFRLFCIPFDDQLYREFGAGLPDGKGMHMCGRSGHLHAALTGELHITSFNLFGALVPPELARVNLGGKCRLWGNLDPLLLLNGTTAEVKDAALRCLRALAPFGGFTLGDGANVCPATPPENLNAVVEAAEEYGNPLAAFA